MVAIRKGSVYDTLPKDHTPRTMTLYYIMPFGSNMPQHRVYASIVQAVKDDRLNEPFSAEDFRRASPGFGEGTYQAFLYKHREGNPGGNSELFEQVGPDLFRVLRPFKYGFDP